MTVASRLRRGSERGAVIVEAALLTPIFILLLFAVVDWGVTMHNRLSVADMSNSGARASSSEGNEPLSDYHALLAMKKSSGALSTGEIRAIVLFRASGPESVVPEACKTASVSGTCNRYTGGDLAKAEDQFGCIGPPGPLAKIDKAWCPTDRKVAISGPNGPPDHVGVYVEAVHEHFVGFFGTPKTLSATTVMRIEPRLLQ